MGISLKEIGTSLHLALAKTGGDEGWEPEEGWELTVLVKGGSDGPITVGPVSKIITLGDGVVVWSEGSEDVNWVSEDSVIILSSRVCSGKTKGKRTGFA